MVEPIRGCRSDNCGDSSIYLPTDRQVLAFAGGVEKRRARGETVLVIDDDPAVCEILRALLKVYGYNPLVAADGLLGLECYRSLHQTIQVVITDMLMPGIKGIEVIRELRRINADARVVLMSGGTNDHIELASEPGRLTFLQKPMTGEELNLALLCVMPRASKVKC